MVILKLLYIIMLSFPNYKSIIESIENKNINIDATIVSQGIISFQKKFYWYFN